MLKVAITDLQNITKGECFFSFKQDVIHWISIDSRSLHNSTSTLFFALSGDNHDGHDYIPELIQQGVRNFVVSQLPLDTNKANFIVVKDALKALQQLAAYHRLQYQLPIIAITGSNGKTIVKEWMSHLLAPDYSVIKSPKSFNSQVGVPLSVFAINNSHTIGVFEAGISTINEMANLTEILQPSIGILTNIGSAHDQGFVSRKQKIQEKIKLFRTAEILIYKKDVLVDEVLFSEEEFLKNKRLYSWSLEDAEATVFVPKIDYKKTHSNLQIKHRDVFFEVKIPFIDKASIENTVTCLTALLSLDVSVTTIQSRLLDLFPVQMRLQLKPSINQCTLIDDSYSNDLQSLTIALDFLEHQKKHRKKTIIISDIEQSGVSSNELYAELFSKIKENHIDRIIVIGKEISQFKTNDSILTYDSTIDFITDLPQIHFENETILIKGARNFHFEKIVKALEYRKHETVLEVDLDAITHNLNFYKSRLQFKTKMMVMIKAFGYGNGGFELAKLLAYHRVDYLGVAFADEGIALQEAGISSKIMVMNPEISSFKSIVKHNLEPEIYNFRGLYAFLKVAEELQLQAYPVHIKIDTGMHRLGFEEKDISELSNILKSTTTIRVTSILSHLVASDSPMHHSFTKDQLYLFLKLTDQLIRDLSYRPILHIANTSGIVNYPEAHLDMVRLGIGLYGIGNSESEQIELQNVSTLKSVISQIKYVPKGESIGYNRMYYAKYNMKTATIPIGYADGISRSLSNGVGHVYINGYKASIIGNICMDMLMLDVTDVGCQEGDEVIIFGKEQSPTTIASLQKTIPYEILTGISHRVKRIFFRS